MDLIFKSSKSLLAKTVVSSMYAVSAGMPSVNLSSSTCVCVYVCACMYVCVCVSSMYAVSAGMPSINFSSSTCVCVCVCERERVCACVYVCAHMCVCVGGVCVWGGVVGVGFFCFVLCWGCWGGLCGCGGGGGGSVFVWIHLGL